MRFKNIRTYFYLALIVSVCLRFLQYFYALDPVTGFVKPAYKLIGFGLLIAVFTVAFSVMIISLFIRRCPVKLPHMNRLLGGCSLILALCIIYDITSMGTSASIPSWQPVLLIITGAFTAIFFVALFIKSLKSYPIPAVCYAVPITYYLVRLIYTFTASSTISLISDNLLYIASEVFTVLFMFQFCLVANKLDQSTGYKKIAISGFSAVIFSLSASFPQLMAVAFHTPASRRVDLSYSALTFFTGIFILCFLRRHFSGSNLKSRRKHKRVHTKFMDGEKTNDFYVG